MTQKTYFVEITHDEMHLIQSALQLSMTTFNTRNQPDDKDNADMESKALLTFTAFALKLDERGVAKLIQKLNESHEQMRVDDPLADWAEVAR